MAVTSLPPGTSAPRAVGLEQPALARVRDRSGIPAAASGEEIGAESPTPAPSAGVTPQRS